MATANRPKHTVPESLRRQLLAIHKGLLHVHKALIDYERGRYEREHGRVATAGEFLELVISHPWFAWLRPMTELIVQIDEYTESKKPVDESQGHALIDRARDLLVPSESAGFFQREYHRALQESSEVGNAHAEWKLMVNQMKHEGKGQVET